MTEYVLSLSYGKDSIACLEAIKLLGLPLDRIVHAEVWATDTIPADLPPMVEFKAKADRIILERYGIEVEHLCAVRERESASKNTSIGKDVTDKSTAFPRSKETGVPQTSKPEFSTELEKVTYEKLFYHIPKRRTGGEQYEGLFKGFPLQRNPWCNKLKTEYIYGTDSKTLRISDQHGQRELVYQTQDRGFLIAPLHKVLR